MIYLRGIAIGLGIWALLWAIFYAGVALAESDYTETAMKLFWVAYCVWVGILISKGMRKQA